MSNILEELEKLTPNYGAEIIHVSGDAFFEPFFKGAEVTSDTRVFDKTVGLIKDLFEFITSSSDERLIEVMVSATKLKFKGDAPNVHVSIHAKCIASKYIKFKVDTFIIVGDGEVKFNVNISGSGSTTLVDASRTLDFDSENLDDPSIDLKQALISPLDKREFVKRVANDKS